MKSLICILGLFFTVSLQAQIAYVEQNLKPLYELGFMVGHVALPDYPGSDEYRYRTIPFPYFIYRGDILKSDDKEGTRLELHKNSKFDVDLSFGGSFPTEGNQNRARQGMPNLDWTLEIGPRILYYFFRNNKGYLRLGLPLRGSFSTDFNTTKFIGYTFAPTLQYDRYHFLNEKMNAYILVSYNYLNEGSADYFYEVSPRYATAERRSYDAREGSLSFESAAGIKYNFSSGFLVIGARHSDLSHSANKTGPLHRTDTNWSYLIAFGTTFYDSEEKVIR